MNNLPPEPPGTVLQVCSRGHVFTRNLRDKKARKTCPDCGEAAVKSCPDCGATISIANGSSPSRCQQCKSYFSWAVPLPVRMGRWLRSRVKGLGKFFRKHLLPSLSLGTLLALVGLYVNYVNNGADSLRTEVYEPLYSEVVLIEQSVQSLTPSRTFETKAFDSLTQKGELYRLPKSIRSEIQHTYEESTRLQGEILFSDRTAETLVAVRIQQIRAPESDREFVDAIAAAENAHPTKDLFGGPTFSFSLQHAARGPSLDFRDPQRPKFGTPGSITWQVKDWVEFPTSAQKVDKIWSLNQFVSFDETRDLWFVRITRADLQRANLTLEEFLQPIYDELKRDESFRHLVATQAVILQGVTSLKQKLAARIESPKKLRDLSDK